VKLVSNGEVLAVLPVEISDRLVTCMQAGWRYKGQIVPLGAGVARATIEARRLG